MATATKMETLSPTSNGATESAPISAIKLVRIQMVTIQVPIRGITPCIPHRWSEKSKRMMLEAMQTVGAKAKAPKAAKDPEREAHDACYWMADGRPAVLAVAFKGAIVGACRMFTGITMAQTRQMVFVNGEAAIGSDGLSDVLVALNGETQMREDTPRNSNGGVDLRYRTQVWPWTAELSVSFPKGRIDAESVVALIDAAGQCSGVGDWRPGAPKSNTGTYGRFEVAL